MLTINKQLITATATSTGVSSSDQQLEEMIGYCIAAIWTAGSPAVKNFVAADVSVADNTITIAAHGYLTGLKVALSGTNLPTGLSATDYYIIKVDVNTIKLATSQALALAGTAVDITGQGTTNDAALTPAVLAGTIKLQGSVSAQNATSITYFDITSSSQAISASGSYYWNVDAAYYNHLRVVSAITAGQATVEARMNAKGV